GIGERVLLRVDRAGLDGGDRLGQVPAQGDSAEEFEGPRLHFARQHADAHGLEVGGRAHGAQPVWYLTEAGLEIAKGEGIDPRLYAGGEMRGEVSVDCRGRLIAVLEQKRQIDEAELRHAVGEIARRLVAERHFPVFDEREDFLSAVAVIHDVPDIVHADAGAE